MRVLGDEYVKGEFRAHREVENPMHIVRLHFPSPWCDFGGLNWGDGDWDGDEREGREGGGGTWEMGQWESTG